MEPLSAAQLRAVRWYIGDVEGDDPFWGDPKAYVTLNSLFFPGISAEQARVREGKRLNPAILSDETRLLETMQDLLSAFYPLEQGLRTYRIERYCDFLQMREYGRTLSFTSTSTAGFLPAYRDREGITLMRLELVPGTLCLPMAQVLPHYAKADEAEVLLPPGTRLFLRELPRTPDELRILDANGDPPVMSVLARTEGLAEPEDLPHMPLDRMGVRVLTALSTGKIPEEGDLIRYQQWKHAFAAWTAQRLCGALYLKGE